MTADTEANRAGASPLGDSALYGLCPNWHPRHVRTIEEAGGVFQELYCPTCERNGTVGMLVIHGEQ